jgi:hypothetical protein
MSITWPATLPQKFLVDGYSEAPPDNSSRHDPDEGAALARKKYTAAVGKLSGKMLMTSDQVEILDEFFRTYGGFTEFVFPKPRTGATITCRMTEPPQYTPHGGLNWKALIKLEVLV